MSLNITMHGKIGGDIIDLHPKTDVSQVEGLNSATTVSTEFLNKVSTSSPLAKIKKLEGKSVGVNQLVDVGEVYTNTVTDTRTYLDYQILIQNVGEQFRKQITTVNTEILGFFTATASGNATIRHNGSASNITICSASVPLVSGHKYYTNGIVNTLNLSTVGGLKITGLMVIDLTLIFGSGSEPSTVDNLKSAWLTKFGYPLPTYIPYNSGSIVDTDIKGIGATGKNIWDEEWEVGGLGSNGENITVSTKIRSKNYILVNPSTSYFINTTKWSSLSCYDVNKAYIGSATVSLNGSGYTLQTKEGTRYLRFALDNSYGAIYKNDIAILVGTSGSYVSASPYYRSFPIVLRSAGTVKDTVEDCGNGYKVTRRVGSVDLGSLNWTCEDSSSKIFTARISNKAKSDSGLLCSHYPYVGHIGYTYTDKTISDWGATQSSEAYYTRICVKDTAYTDATAFKTAMNGVMLNYELATPITKYHSYNLTYPVTLNGTEYFDSPISVPCEIEYGVDALTDIVSGVVGGDTERDNGAYDLLWENASPTSGFASQVVTFDRGIYRFFLIEVNLTTSYTNYKACFEVENNVDTIVRTTIAANMLYYREAKVVGNGIQFENSVKFPTYGSSSTADNAFLIPYRIYGIK